MNSSQVLKNIALIALAKMTVKALRKANLSPEKADQVIDLLNTDSFCDLVEKTYHKYLEQLDGNSDPGKLLLEELPQQTKIWRENNLDPLIAAIKEDY